VTSEDLHRVIGLLKATFSHLIFDLSKGYNAVDQVALEAADHILLVTQLDLPCLRNVVRLLMSMEEMEGLKDKVRIVVNRTGLDNGQISLKKAEETIGREIYWRIPNDYRLMSEVRNNGVPLIEHAPRAALTQSMIGLAENMCAGVGEESEDGAAPRTGRWLSFWPGRSKTK
jgi:pilus assembly protein CpaE